ncbi:hypothetical protein PIB30_107926 [Stylosanthes scabra]|uniref:DUF4283 domain-containing protein n=1 Tax=Stylosanthes scabra TaxID=79078 RepID=A0ABU6U1D3_9FABA|nr:hypothetical protein [Stylosanthes scabra]
MMEQKKEIEAIWSDEQRLKLQRSLLGVSVKPIEFRKVMNLLFEEWKGSGETKRRDVGPYQCLITFFSPEIRDAAMEDQLLQSVFDEIRPHWNIFWSLSRHVWIEIMDFPIFMEENSDSMEEPKTVLVVEETQAEQEQSPASSGRTNLNLKNVGDPQLDAIINCNLIAVLAINWVGDNGGAGVGSSRHELMKNVHEPGVHFYNKEGCGVLGLDPMVCEAQIAAKKKIKPKQPSDEKGGGPIVAKKGPIGYGGLDS